LERSAECKYLYWVSVREESVNSSSCYVEVKTRRKAFSATNYTDFHEWRKTFAQISEIRGKDFQGISMVATWVK